MPEQQNESIESEFLEYLKTDLTAVKIQNGLLKDHAARWASVAITAVAGLILCCVIFAGSIFLMNQEHTKRIDTIFTAKWEASTTIERERVITETSPSANGDATVMVNKEHSSAAMANGNSSATQTTNK